MKLKEYDNLEVEENKVSTPKGKQGETGLEFRRCSGFSPFLCMG